MNTPADQARDRLARNAHRKDAARRLGLAAATVSGLLLGLLLIMLLDYGLGLPTWVRAAAGVALLAALGAGWRRWQTARRRRTSLKEAALDLESARPGLGCEVSTASEYLSGGRTPGNAHESELAAALSLRAARVASEEEQAGTVDYRRSLGLPGLLFGGGVLTGLLVFLVVAPQSGTAVRRALAPWSGAHFTGLAVEPAGGEFPVGHRLTLTNRLSGRIPRSVEFQWREDGQTGWRTEMVDVASNLPVAFHALTVSASGTFRIRAGDHLSAEFPLVAYIPPEVSALSVRLVPPAYSGLPELRQSSPALTALRGTRALVELEGNVALGRAELALTNGTVVALVPAASNLWRGELTLFADSSYSIVIADSRGRPGLANSVRHPIRALPDLPPKVDVTEPGEDIRADPDELIPLKVAASDDFGLESITLVYHVLGGPEYRLEVRDRHTKDGQTLGAVVLRLESLGVKPYDVVAYHAEARDNNTLDGPGIGRSPTYFIELTDRSGPPPTQRKSQGPPQQRLNLIAIQKGLLADTTGLATNAAPKATADLAGRQREARALTARYQERLESMNAPKGAQFALDEALEGMDDAAKALDQRSPKAAIPAEEKALAALYRAIKAMPQLKNLPTNPDLALQPPDPSAEPPPPQIVLEAIEKKPKTPAESAEEKKALEEALQEALALAQAQSELTDRMDGKDSKGDQGDQGDKGDKGDKGGRGQDGKKGRDGQGDSPGEPGRQGQGRGQPGRNPGQGSGPGQPGQPGGQPPGPGAPADPSMAGRQRQLQERARRLAERIDRLAKPKTGESPEAKAAGQRVAGAADQMAQAAEALGSGRSDAAGSSGSLAAAGVQSAADLLERALRPGTERTDVSAEEAPAQFEEQIAEYFRRLTRAQ